MIALYVVLGLFTMFVVLAVYTIHKTKASRVRFSAEFWQSFRFNFSADSPSDREGPNSHVEP